MNFSFIDRSKSILITGVVALVAASCSFHHQKDSDTQGLTQVDPTYVSIRDNILIPKCVECHSAPKPPHGIDLTTYDGVLGKGLMHVLVRPGIPEESDLYKSCKSGKMPKKRDHLSIQELSAIYEWIKNGAPETADGPPAQPIPQPSHTPEPPDEDTPPPPHAGHGEPCDGVPGPNEPGPIEPCH